MDRNIYILFIGRFVSLLGNGIFLIVLPLYLLEQTNDLSYVGLFFMIIKIPTILLSLNIGVFVENRNKKRMIVVCDVVSFILFLLLVLLLNNNISTPLIYITVISVTQIISKVFSVSSSVLFTVLTNDKDRLKLNSYKGILDNIVLISYPAIGAILYTFIGIQGILLLNALTFLISALLESFIKYDFKELNDDKVKVKFKDYKEIFSWIKTRYTVFSLFITTMVLNFFMSPIEEVIFPGILIQKYNFKEMYFSVALTSLAVGSLTANVMIAKIESIKHLQLRNLFIMSSAIFIIMGLISLSIYNINSNLFYILFIVLVFSAGISISFVNVPLITSFHNEVPSEIQGRFFSTLSLFSSLLIPIGIAVGGVSSKYLGADVTLIINNSLVILIVIVLVKPQKKSLK